ncbi:MAG TPA: glycosyltransferase family 2 protein [Anaerolineales bacterium]|nr:glycosyltransferase family 2 protein [Anaerolineales bacterium]
MSEGPLVSVVTPSLNQGKFIAAAIQSVLSQDYSNLEYIVMDGGSTDETLSILAAYGARVRWVSEKDDGQAQAINKGWRRARGDILTWLNADEILSPGAVRRAVLALEADGGLAGVYGDCVYVNEAGDVLGDYPSRAFDYGRLVELAEDFIPQPGTFLRRGWVERVGGLDESLHFVMDYDLWLRLGMVARLEYLPVEMARARLHGGAKTAASAPRFGDELASVFLRLVEHPDFPADLSARRKIILANAYIHAASYCFWGGETRRARQYLFRAWQQKPYLRNRSFWRLWLFSLGGKAGWRLAERLHGNPFRLQQGLLR